MPDDIELASPDEIAAQRALWLIENPPPPPKYLYTEERNQKLQEISETYRLSEEKRKEARPWFMKPADKRRRDKKEDAKFAKVPWKKFEDPEYYGIHVGTRDMYRHL